MRASLRFNLADADHAPSDELIRLYGAWADGEVGLMITGNVMVDRQFMPPKAMSEADIAEVKARFVRSAVLAETFGFNGVQIHAAHGYLFSQFLSPHHQPAGRPLGWLDREPARILIDVVKAVRAAVGPAFAVAVKLNSADFQRGGFSAEDAKRVVSMLNPLGVDLIELSGGSYEAPAMHGQARDGRTLAREAYFLELAGDIASVAQMPIMVTGGIRRLPVAEQVIASGIDMAGMAVSALDDACGLKPPRRLLICLVQEMAFLLEPPRAHTRVLMMPAEFPVHGRL